MQAVGGQVLAALLGTTRTTAGASRRTGPAGGSGQSACSSAHDVPVSLIFPMISTLDEFGQARRLLDETIAKAGLGFLCIS
ncbi:MAG: hypothetical protein ACRDTG_25060, partial [Pseudonocardiaceae bacterium]